MSRKLATESNEIFRSLPSVDALLQTKAGSEYIAVAGQAAAAEAARSVVAKLRDEVLSSQITARSRPELLEFAESQLKARVLSENIAATRRVINATGVIIHTNLGRAPLSKMAQDAMAEAAEYSPVEYDLETGQRGRRGGLTDSLLAELAGAEDAVVVNNGAAAAFLILTALASGRPVIISRGELVEIGGDFRIPDVLSASGATLKEVGTTNRTKLADYSTAITPETAMILRVHRSNFKITGFTAAPERTELASLTRNRGLILYEDLGSGALVDVGRYGLKDEPIVRQAIEGGAEIVSFSGDKLLGGPQTGIIAGRKDLVGLVRRHPLFRVVRADKMTYAALYGTLVAYRRGTMYEDIPVLRMLSWRQESIGDRAARVLSGAGPFKKLQLVITDGTSAVGGGAAPGVELPTRLISLSHPDLSAEELEYRLRMNPIPVIARIEAGRVLLDLRTVTVEDEAMLVEALRRLDP